MQTQWSRRGYVIAHGLLDVSEAVEAMRTMFPPSEPHPVQDFGNSGEGEFPCNAALDRITVHPTLLKIVRKMLDTDHVLLTQSVAWRKDGGNGKNADQRMHIDAYNHYYGVPPTRPDMVAAIVYYSDTTETGGATAVVPQQDGFDPVYSQAFAHMPGVCGIPFANPRKEAEDLMSVYAPESAKIREEAYEREVQPDFKPGDVLFYRMDTWHRGTPVLPNRVRYVHNLAWRRADSEGIQQWNPGFTRKLYSGNFERFIASIAPHQLETLGFPARRSKKWLSEEFCDSIRLRYEWAGFDVDAYIIMPEEPGPVPDFWPFSKTTMSGTDAKTLRDSLFATLRTLGAHVSVLSSNWRWKLEYCVGPDYLVAEIHIFSNGDEYIVDIQQVQGDRWAWQGFLSRLFRKPTTPAPERFPVDTTSVQTKRCIENGTLYSLGPSVVYDVGQDMPPDTIVPFLKSQDLNTVRMAMFRLACFRHPPNDCKDIQKWLQMPSRNFMEREIAKHASQVMQKESCL